MAALNGWTECLEYAEEKGCEGWEEGGEEDSIVHQITSKRKWNKIWMKL